jgi:DNA-binding NarL/FixJ family response regulator
MTISVLIVDDHAIVRQGLRMLLSLDRELEIVGEAANGVEALEQVSKLKPDVVLMDLVMPIMDGIRATELIHRDFPQTEVIALTSVLEDGSVISAIKAGAIGYMLKDTNSDDLSKTIKAAGMGQVMLSPQAAARLMREVKLPDSPVALTNREVEVLRLLASGKSNKEIALELMVSETTIKTHVSSILLKLNLPSRTQAALYAIRIGLVTIPAA